MVRLQAFCALCEAINEIRLLNREREALSIALRNIRFATEAGEGRLTYLTINRIASNALNEASRSFVKRKRLMGGK